MKIRRPGSVSSLSRPYCSLWRCFFLNAAATRSAYRMRLLSGLQQMRPYCSLCSTASTAFELLAAEQIPALLVLGCRWVWGSPGGASVSSVPAAARGSMGEPLLPQVGCPHCLPGVLQQPGGFAAGAGTALRAGTPRGPHRPRPRGGAGKAEEPRCPRVRPCPPPVGAPGPCPRSVPRVGAPGRCPRSLRAPRRARRLSVLPRGRSGAGFVTAHSRVVSISRCFIAAFPADFGVWPSADQGPTAAPSEPRARGGWAATPRAGIWVPGGREAFQGSQNRRRSLEVPPAPFINLSGTILIVFCVGNLQGPRYPVFLVCNKALGAEQRASYSVFRMQAPEFCPHWNSKFALPSVAIYLMPYGGKKWGLSDHYMVSSKWFKWLSEHRTFLFCNLFSSIKLQVKAADHIKSNYS